MRVVAKFQIKQAEKVLKKNYPNELQEVYDIIKSVDAKDCLDKVSKERTKKGKILYSPVKLNKLFKGKFEERGWKPEKIKCKYSAKYYLPSYRPPRIPEETYREIDFVKNKVGVEVQFGKYAFMVYNVCAKMTIFHNKKKIEVGIEIVPVKELQDKMSTGVAYFEQFVWDLENRGEADIDIPVLILGVAP